MERIKNRNVDRAYSRIVADTKSYTIYDSYDDKNRTFYDKKTYEIYYIIKRRTGSNRFKKDKE